MAKPFKRPRSIIGAFARAARRFVLGAALGIGTLLPASAFSQQKEAALPAQPTTEMLGNTVSRIPLAFQISTDTAYNQTVNRFLLEEAKKEYAELCKNLPPYSRALADLQDRLNVRLDKAGGRIDDVVVLDPYKFDIAFAIGFQPPDAVMLQLQGHEGSFTTLQIYGAARALTAGHMTDYRVETYTSNPMTLSATFNRVAGPALLVPISDHAPLVQIKGLTREGSALLVNTHESWHVLDNRYDFGHIDFSKIGDDDLSDFNLMANNPSALEFYSVKSKKETFADVASVGELIRKEGFGTDLIGKVIAFRTDGERPGIAHMSAPALESLKRKIERMGLADFRKLDDQQAEKLYYRLTERHGMTPESLRAGIIYEGASDKAKSQMHVKAIFNREVKKALKFKKHFTKDAVFHLDKKDRKSLSEETYNTLKSWNPLQELQDRAFAAEGKITPSTLSKTYLQMQGEFSAKMKEEPKNDVYPEKMALLKVAFVLAAEDLDYVRINAERGVSIMPPLKTVNPFVPFLRL